MNFAGITVWRERFSHLEKFGMAHVYLALLGFARSANELRRMHDDLPSHARVMRNDLRLLTEFWQQHFQEVGPCHQLKPQPASTQWVLEQLCPDSQTASEYYLQQIDAVNHLPAPPIPKYETEFGDLVYTAPSDSGTSQYYLASMFGREVRARVWLMRDLRHILVRFSFWQYWLDEPLTHAIISRMPPFTATQPCASTDKGVEIGLTYALDSQGIKTHIGCMGSLSESRKTAYCYAEPSFFAVLSNELRRIGLPIEGDVVALIEAEEK